MYLGGIKKAFDFSYSLTYFFIHSSSLFDQFIWFSILIGFIPPLKKKASLEMAVVDEDLRRRQQRHRDLLANFDNVREASVDGASLVNSGTNGRDIDENVR